MSCLDHSRTGVRKPAPHPKPTSRVAASTDVAADLDAWKRAMHEERRVRLQSSHAVRRQPAAAAPVENHERKPEPRAQDSSMSMQQFRKHLHEVNARKRESAANRNRSLSSSGSPRRSVGHGLDPLDVYYKPAVSTVKQLYMKEPIPFFVRRNKFGTLDGYADQAAATIYRQRERGESSRGDLAAASAAGASSWNRPTEAIRPIRASSPVWRHESPRLQAFPTPRSTMLRQSYIASRHRRETSEERSAPRQRSRVVVSHAPVQSNVHARLVGPPWASPAWSRYQPNVDSVLRTPEVREKPFSLHSDVSPHQHGDSDLPRRTHVDPASAYHYYADKTFHDDDDFDPVPLGGGAPSPHRRPHHGVDEDTRAKRPGARRVSSPEHRQLSSPTGRAPTAWASSSSPHDRPDGLGMRHSFPVWGASDAHLSQARSPLDGGGVGPNNHASPPVDVSPPTPAGMLQQRAPTASPQRNDRADPQQGKPFQNLLTQLALPTMRHSRPDLFQGHPNRAKPYVMEDDERQERTGNLRRSPLHDRLEQQLTQRLRSPAAHIDPSSPTGGGKDLSMSRALLHQLATKRLQ